jgi:hypothetical protein
MKNGSRNIQPNKENLIKQGMQALQNPFFKIPWIDVQAKA